MAGRALTRGVTTGRFNLNISPKMSYGVLAGEIGMLQNYTLATVSQKGGVACAGSERCSH